MPKLSLVLIYYDIIVLTKLLISTAYIIEDTVYFTVAYRRYVGIN